MITVAAIKSPRLLLGCGARETEAGENNEAVLLRRGHGSFCFFMMNKFLLSSEDKLLLQLVDSGVCCVMLLLILVVLQ